MLVKLYDPEKQRISRKIKRNIFNFFVQKGIFGKKNLIRNSKLYYNIVFNLLKTSTKKKPMALFCYGFKKVKSKKNIRLIPEKLDVKGSNF